MAIKCMRLFLECPPTTSPFHLAAITGSAPPGPAAMASPVMRHPPGPASMATPCDWRTHSAWRLTCASQATAQLRCVHQGHCCAAYHVRHCPTQFFRPQWPPLTPEVCVVDHNEHARDAMPGMLSAVLGRPCPSPACCLGQALPLPSLLSWAGPAAGCEGSQS